MKKASYLLFSAILLLLSCSKAENEFSREACFFIFDNATHQDMTLASAMNNASPGVFCRVTKGMKSGATTFSFANNQGLSSSAIANAVDMKRSIVLGINNGLIVGFGNLNMPATFYAYDAQCPNCTDPDAVPLRNHPLEMTSAGLAICNTCHRSYDMNNGGIITAGEQGKKLIRYRGSTTGPLGVLSVNN